MTTRRGAVAAALAGLTVAALAIPAGAAPPKRQASAAGNALAKAVVLRPSDLGAGWKSTGSGGSSGGADLTCAGFNPNQSDLTTIGNADRSFESSDQINTVRSRVAVFRSAAE